MMRPKSIATVVVVFVVTSPALSTPMLCDVIAASVVSGVISEIEPTKVVLPTANPPAMTIFTGSMFVDVPPVDVDVGVGWLSDRANATENPF